MPVLDKTLLNATLLLVDDDTRFLDRWKRNLVAVGFTVETADGAPAALRKLARQKFDLMLTDVRMPADNDGIELLRTIRAGDASGVDPDLPVIMLTSVDSTDTAVSAMRLGATDYIQKQAERDEIVVRIAKALEKGKLTDEYKLIREQIDRNPEFGDTLIGNSAAMERIKLEIESVASKNVPVLITGETGVGKEMIARSIYRNSDRRNEAFIDVNCAALPDENMLQSELFGHEKGAFTGATAPRKGRFELAHKGTLFLDEIGEMSAECQSKVLKALEQHEVTRLGGNYPIKVDCRFIFATNRDLGADVKKGLFRQDLYYRVNVFPIQIPPLRDRVDDIQPLAEYFCRVTAQKYTSPPLTFADDAIELMNAYSWPGNIRELRNIVERLVIHGAPDGIITPDMIRAAGVYPEGAPARAAAATDGKLILPPKGCRLDEVERDLILQALERTGGNQRAAAELVGLTEDQINKRVKKYGWKKS